MIYRNLHYCQKGSFDDILRKFDANWTFIIDSVCLLGSMPKIGIHFMMFVKCFDVDNIASFVTLNPVVKYCKKFNETAINFIFFYTLSLFI